MKISELLLIELRESGKSTRKLLERIPVNSFNYKPHEKSFTLIRLASHIAELPGWITSIISTDEFDFGKTDYEPSVVNTLEELLKINDDNILSAEKSLDNIEDTEFNKIWTMRNNETIYFSLPKIVTIREFAFNHLYHHRGQLTVYLRLLNIPLPMIFGPSADESGM